MVTPPRPDRDRRIFGRLTMAQLPVHVAVADGGEVSICSMDLIDMSMTGAGLHHDRSVKTGASVVIRIEPDDRRGMLPLPGRVLYCRPEGGDEGRWFVGIGFGTLESDTHARLARWLFVQHHRRAAGRERRQAAASAE